MTETFHLQVYGTAWGGFKACYQYTLTRSQADKALHDDNAKQFAGDFEALSDWRLVQEENAYEPARGGISRRVDTFKTLRGFRNGMTPRRFSQLINS